MDESFVGLKKFLTKYADVIENRKQNIDLYEEEFQRIKSQGAEDKKNIKSFEGARDCNRKKNRYKDILPYDYTRVQLLKNEFVDGSDYINANFIKDDTGEVCYIASQGPMPNTVDDFWQMILHFDIQLVIMACKEVELGKPRCQRYWPLSVDEPCQFDNVTVFLVKQEKLRKNMKLRELKATTKNGKELKLTQLHYMDWPDHGAPETSETILHLIEKARQIQSKNIPPILIHCSAGCGRTGAIIAIDYARKLILKKAPEINVLDIVSHLRKQRPAMVQSKEQYEFIYEVMREMITEELKKYDEDCTPTYVNIAYIPRNSPVFTGKIQTHQKYDNQIMHRAQSESAFVPDDTSRQTSKRIVLPEAHVQSTEAFRRSRSLYGKNSQKSIKVPPVPRKSSDGNLLAPKLSSIEKPRQPLVPPNKPRIQQEETYVNLTAIPGGTRLNEDFFPPPTPGSYMQYPMKSKITTNASNLCNMVDQLQINATPESISHDPSKHSSASSIEDVSSMHPSRNNTKDISIPSVNYKDPSGGFLSKINKLEHATEDGQHHKQPNAEHTKETQSVAQPAVIKPYYVAEIGVYGRTEKEKIQKDAKMKEVKSVSHNDGWLLQVQSNTDEIPPLPERTPESFEIIRKGDLVTLDVTRHKRSHPVHDQKPATSSGGGGVAHSKHTNTLSSTSRDDKPCAPSSNTQNVLTRTSSTDFGNSSVAVVAGKKNWKNAFKMNLGKKSKHNEEAEVPSQDANKIMFADTLYELKSLGFPSRISAKIDGPPPPPPHWPKFPS